MLPRPERHHTVNQSGQVDVPVPYRLAAVTSHPVQYQAPLFRQVASHGDIEFTAFYGHDGSIHGEVDRDFGLRVSWGTDLLDGYRSVFLQRRSIRLNALQRLAADLRIISHLWRGQFDAVFVHSYATRLSLLAYIGALASRTPVLLRTESEGLRPRPWWVQAFKRVSLGALFGLTAGFLVIGKANRLFLETYGVSPQQQFFTPYSVDNEYFAQQRDNLHTKRRELRHRHGWTDDTVVIGFSGKLIARKGVPDLVDAVAELQAESLPVGLLLIGDGPDRAALERRVQSRGLTEVVFGGFTGQSELGACYTSLDIFVLPARFDTWGLVVNEAMVFGLPVLATNMVGAGMDLIRPGHNGYIYGVGDVGALTRHLRCLVNSADARRAFGTHSRDIVEGYSYDECVLGILAALRYVGRRSTKRSSAVAPEYREQ